MANAKDTADSAPRLDPSPLNVMPAVPPRHRAAAWVRPRTGA
jgi:hypothetical protein